MKLYCYLLLSFFANQEVIASQEQRPTHGVLAAEVSSSSAIIWARGNASGVMHTRIYSGSDFSTHQVRLNAADDYTGQIFIANLKPNSDYRYEVWIETEDDVASKRRVFGAQQLTENPKISEGSFRTAPHKDAQVPVSFAWTGDFGGQNVCRDRNDGYPIFAAIRDEQADFFVGLGDMIYADGVCKTKGRYGNRQIPGDFVEARDLDSFWAHWRYNRADRHSQELFVNTAYYGVWDDHEVVNDFGPKPLQNDPQAQSEHSQIVSIGMRAFLNYSPIKVTDVDPHRLYRKVRWGQHAELFFLDTRQYRDANLAQDSEHNPKTMLGQTQFNWLVEQLAASDATWKIIVSSVPISIPTGFPSGNGRDGWANHDENNELTIDGVAQSATGFEQEMSLIMRHLKAADANAVFISTDVHFAEVFGYQPFIQSGHDFVVHEFVVGPGNAGVFPNRSFDKSFGSESLFFYGPDNASDIKNWEQAKEWFNYGMIDISKEGVLTAQVKGVNGASLYELTIQPK